MGKNKINPDIKEKLKGLKLSSISFQAGGIYKTSDEKVLFPTRKNVKDKPRMVVVMGNEKDLNDPTLPHVLAVPITTVFDLETTQDLPVDAGVGNLYEASIIKAGMIQPILKSDIQHDIGIMDTENFENLKATVFMNLGLGEEDADEEVEDSSEGED